MNLNMHVSHLSLNGYPGAFNHGFGIYYSASTDLLVPKEVPTDSTWMSGARFLLSLIALSIDNNYNK